jgi:chromosome segregation ATPase
MPAVGEVSFELERFEWTADDRLEVVGRWNGIRGRRIARPALTVDAGGRRQRLSGTQVSDDPWCASFAWAGEDIAGAELEIGRTLVVELPPPRRRRRRSGATAESDLRAQLEETRLALAALQAERDRLAARDDDAARQDTQRDDRSAELAAALEERDRLLETARAESAERDRLAAELDAVRGEREPRVEAEQELAGLRLAHGSLKASHEALEDELEELRAIRDERDELNARLEQLKASATDDESEKASLGEAVRRLQAEQETLRADLAVAREEIARLEREVSERDRSLAETQQDAERRVESERATNTEIHARLATAREETQKTIAAEAEETERLRGELEQLRADHERALGAERAEVARLREELLSSETVEDDEGSRRMLERITRDLERERAVARNLKRELDTLRSELAEQRRQISSQTANGTLQMDDPPARAVRTPEGTRRRVDAARANAAQRVPRVPPSPVALWTVRVFATLLVAVMGILLVLLIKAVT